LTVRAVAETLNRDTIDRVRKTLNHPMLMPDLTIDTRGLACPLPILKVRKMMRGLPSGAEVEVLATDPGSEIDLRAYCAATGNKFLQYTLSPGGEMQFVIRKQ
jgi:tRNA 2-thiouridine synthesizing protein A